MQFADSSLAELVQRVASTEPSPGAGPSTAWTCALAAALVEMVSAITLGGEPANAAAVTSRRDRAAELRARALGLAEEDSAAYGAVLEVLRRREEPGHGGRLREALSRAADPPLAVVEAAAEIVGLSAGAAADARGAVRGEAVTAAVLAEAVVRAGVRLVDLNLAGARDDPRRARAADLVAGAAANLDLALRNS